MCVAAGGDFWINRSVNKQGAEETFSLSRFGEWHDSISSQLAASQ